MAIRSSSYKDLAQNTLSDFLGATQYAAASSCLLNIRIFVVCDNVETDIG